MKPPLEVDRLALIVPVPLLLLALSELPYGYYTLLRIVVCGCALYAAHCFRRREWTIALVLFGMIAVLYNPLIRIHLDRGVWEWLNAGTAIAFGSAWHLMTRGVEAGSKHGTLVERLQENDIVPRDFGLKEDGHD